MMYDYLIVGSGLCGSVFAHEMTKAGKSCLVLERRDHVGGNVYCEEKEDIRIHKYGAHIFHTSNKEVWDYVNQFVEFNNYVNSPVANYKGELYNLPFNMNTFTKMWGVVTPKQAAAKIDCPAAPGSGDYGAKESGRTGHFPYWHGHLYEADQRVHGKTVGTELHGTSGFHHQTPACTLYV